MSMVCVLTWIDTVSIVVCIGWKICGDDHSFDMNILAHIWMDIPKWGVVDAYVEQSQTTNVPKLQKHWLATHCQGVWQLVRPPLLSLPINCAHAPQSGTI